MFWSGDEEEGVDGAEGRGEKGVCLDDRSGVMLTVVMGGGEEEWVLFVWQDANGGGAGSRSRIRKRSRRGRNKSKRRRRRKKKEKKKKMKKNKMMMMINKKNGKAV